MTNVRVALVGMAFGVSVMVSGSAQASIIGTFMAATPGNVGPSSAWASGWDGYNNKWDLSTGAIEPEVAMFTSAAAFEDSPALTMTVSGLTEGPYDVYMVYWSRTDSEGQEWKIQGKLNDGAFGIFDGSTGEATGTFANGIYAQREVKLGTTPANATGFTVTVDDVPGGSNNIAVFEGVSYAAVPEPAVLVLMGAGSGLLRKRR